MTYRDYSKEKGIADEPHWIEFVLKNGGELVSPLIRRQGVKNADFLFRREKIVIELKVLETEFGSQPKLFKDLVALFGEYLRTGKEDRGKFPYGEETLKLFQKPLKRVLAKANQQLKQTKIELGLIDWKGITVIVNDGFRGLPPGIVFGLLARIMSGNNYSTTECVIYLTNHYVEIPDNPYANLLWMPMYADSDDRVLIEFINDLGRKWRGYIEDVMGSFEWSGEMGTMDNSAIRVISGPLRHRQIY